MMIHGAIMEAGTGILMIPLLSILDADNAVQQSVFAIGFFRDNLMLMMMIGIVFGIVRVIGAIGVLKNRMWGFTLAVINCVVTMAVMIFMIPVGIMDGIFACTALVLLLTGYYGKQDIQQQNILG